MEERKRVKLALSPSTSWAKSVQDYTCLATGTGIRFLVGIKETRPTKIRLNRRMPGRRIVSGIENCVFANVNLRS